MKATPITAADLYRVLVKLDRTPNAEDPDLDQITVRILPSVRLAYDVRLVHGEGPPQPPELVIDLEPT